MLKTHSVHKSFPPRHCLLVPTNAAADYQIHHIFPISSIFFFSVNSYFTGAVNIRWHKKTVPLSTINQKGCNFHEVKCSNSCTMWQKH